MEEMKKLFLLLVSVHITSLQIEAVKKNDWIVGKHVLAYYAKQPDTLKYKAAKFLIDNIPFHNSVHSSCLNEYYKGIARINEKYAYPDCISQYDTLYLQLGDVKDAVTIYDTECLNEESLIRNIEMAYSDWRNGLWARHLDFEEFCEYLLPYRVCNEKIEMDWRERLRKEFLPYTDDIKHSEDMRYQSYWAAYTIGSELRKRQLRNKKVLPKLEVEYPVSALQGIRMGECYDYGKITTYIMRACGIPVSFDFTPQWPDRSRNHYWNALYDNTRRTIPFMGYELPPGFPSKEAWRKAKVYRYTFAYQSQSLYAQNQNIGQLIPPILNTPFIKDVSDKYFRTYPIEFQLNNKHLRDSFVYIAVFDNQEWIPVDFAKIDSGRTATFHNMGAEIAYMPIYWTKNGSIPAGDIVILDINGTVHRMTPDTLKLQDLTIYRKYPLFNRIAGFWKDLVGGRIEASDGIDFNNPIFGGKLEKAGFMGYDTIRIDKSIGKHRYWRYCPPKGKRCNIAEIKFYSGKKQICSTRSFGRDREEDISKAFDNNVLSYYESQSTDGWISVDLNENVEIDEVAVLPRNDANEVEVGHRYKLCYFSDGHEIPIGTKTAKDQKLTFSNVPKNAVYILHDETGGSEERIFVYQDNQIIWY